MTEAQNKQIKMPGLWDWEKILIEMVGLKKLFWDSQLRQVKLFDILISLFSIQQS